MDGDWPSVNNRMDGELRVLQPADDLALLVPLRCESRGQGSVECQIRRRCSRRGWISSTSYDVRHCCKPSGAVEVDGFSRRDVSSCESLRAICCNDHVAQGNRH